MNRGRQIIRRRCSPLRRILPTIKIDLLWRVPANNKQHKTAGEVSVVYIITKASQCHPNGRSSVPGGAGTAPSAMFYTQDCSHSSGRTLLYAVKRTRPVLIISDIFLRTRKCKFKPALLFLHVQAYGCRCFHFKCRFQKHGLFSNGQCKQSYVYEQLCFIWSEVLDYGVCVVIKG